MFINEALAQTADAATQSGFDYMSFMPFVLLIFVFYFLLIRPQNKKMKEHREMVSNMRRGDRVITGGGLIGKIHKIADGDEVEIEIAKDTVVTVMRSTITTVLSKTDPVSTSSPANDTAVKKKKAKK